MSGKTQDRHWYKLLLIMQFKILLKAEEKQKKKKKKQNKQKNWCINK